MVVGLSGSGECLSGSGGWYGRRQLPSTIISSKPAVVILLHGLGFRGGSGNFYVVSYENIFKTEIIDFVNNNKKFRP